MIRLDRALARLTSRGRDILHQQCSALPSKVLAEQFLTTANLCRHPSTVCIHSWHRQLQGRSTTQLPNTRKHSVRTTCSLIRTALLRSYRENRWQGRSCLRTAAWSRALRVPELHNTLLNQLNSLLR